MTDEEYLATTDELEMLDELMSEFREERTLYFTQLVVTAAKDEIICLREALSCLVADLEDRAHWMRFQPAPNGGVIPCGNGVYIRAKDALKKKSDV